jgi:hypothetical protein
MLGIDEDEKQEEVEERSKRRLLSSSFFCSLFCLSHKFIQDQFT